MDEEKSSKSAVGVRIADDFRSNLIVDRYDPVFSTMRASKLKHLRSENSEDVVTWNAFRSLRHIHPSAWLPPLWQRAFPDLPVPDDQDAVIHLWPEVDPPWALLQDGDEGASEIDVLIEAPTWVWFIEVKFRSDISTGTTTRPERDQVLRNIDVGSYLSGTRRFVFSLLIASRERSKLGVAKVEEYRELPRVRELLAGHRPDGLTNLEAVGLLNWTDVAAVLVELADSAPREDERPFARRAAEWLEGKGLV